MGVRIRAMVEGIDVVAHTILVNVDQEIETELLRHLIAKRDHLTEFPGRVDVEKGKGRLGRIKRLHRKMHQHRGILADGIEHDRLGESRRYLAKDMDGFSLKPLKVRKRDIHGL
jgi:hypothetical protein